jgi:hypothetical protein
MGDSSDRKPVDLDPAAPGEGDPPATIEDLGSANFGAPGEEPEEPEEGPEALAAAPHTVRFDIDKAKRFLQDCLTSHPRVGYKLGAKIRPGEEPGRDFKNVDCSGFVRMLVRLSTDLGGRFPDGSVVEHEWVQRKGFQTLPRSTGSSRDGAVRIAFLRPQDSPHRIGHVVLIHDGKTLESHRGVGPDSRAWNTAGWESKAIVYLFAPAAQVA